jgi:Skp family chaperone for outer membrane proteins
VDVVEIDIPDELPAPAGKDAPAVPVPAKAEAGRSPAPRRRPAAKTARRSRAPVFLGLGLALVGAGAGVGLILVSARNKGPKPPAPPAVENGTGATPPAPADPREERAREAFAKAQTAASRSESSFEEILAAVDQARDACRGTAFEAKLESLRNKVLREKEMIAAQKEYGALLDELKAAVAGDPEFKRYGDLRQKFQQARDLASRVGASALSDVQRLQQDYSGRYEKAAQPFFDEIREAVTALADVERRFDHALQKIETFPAHLRHSGAWRELERLKADIERRKKASSK